MRFLRLFFLSLAVAASAWAQSIHWEPPAATLSYNQTSELQLVFDDCEPKDEPAVPAVPGLQIQSVGQSSNMSIVNGSVSQSVVITYHARASQRGALTIPTFSVNTSKGRVDVPAVTYQVGDATVGQGNLPLEAVAKSTFDVPKEVWAGEVFKLEYSLNIGRRYFNSLGNNLPDWNPAPLAVEEWSKPDGMETVIGGERRAIISYKTRAVIKQPGATTLNPASQLVNLTTGTQSFGFFARPSLEQFTIPSSRPTIAVRPLPGGAPTSFSGAVGQFTLQSKIVPAGASVGEPITWTLTLAGTGNWPDIHGLPSRDVSRDFHVVQPQARRTPKEGLLFDATMTEDVVLIPTQPGSYTLGPVTWTYFDPAKGSYQTVTTDKVVVVVSAPPVQNVPPTAGSPANPASGEKNPARSGRQPVVPPGAPLAIPRDPLPGSDLAPTPWSQRTLVLAALAPLPILIAFWFGLAWRRARVTDPYRPQREAASRLRVTIAELSTTKDSAGVQRRLQSWQRDAAILWRFAPVVPRPHDFLEDGNVSAESAKRWADLWAEAERVLYRPSETLPTDWTRRAETARQEKTWPQFSARQLFQSRNLLPFAALLILAAFTLPHVVAQETRAKDSYSKGDFAAAEASWRKVTIAQGNDWIARHNLSLALAQQSRWGEASAEAVAAFVQHPNDPAIRWNLAFALDRAGFEPGLLSGFVADSPTYSLARQLSPAEWQRFIVLAASLAAFGLALVLLRFFAPFGSWCAYTGFSVTGLALVGLFLGIVALVQYQEAGDSHSALIWKPSILRSIPTEADASQKTAPLAPGTVAIVDKTFLGWIRLSFSNGQTGWVRQEEIVRLWE